MTNLQEGNDRLNGSGVTDDPGNLADTVDALLAGPSTFICRQFRKFNVKQQTIWKIFLSLLVMIQYEK